MVSVATVVIAASMTVITIIVMVIVPMLVMIAAVSVAMIMVGLAALVTHQKRLALRVPLARETTVGRLRVSLPKNWSTPM